MSAESDAKPLGSRAPSFIKASRPLHLSWRAGIFLVGLAIVVAGVVMLVLPGPGWLVIFGGMAVWGTEFVWAQHVLSWTRRKVREGTQWIKERRELRRELRRERKKRG